MSRQPSVAVRIFPNRNAGECRLYHCKSGRQYEQLIGSRLLMQHDWHTRDKARRAIFRYLETWHNRKRRHPTLGYVTPAAYEAQLQQAA
jgi:transposase InsO family protein